MALVNIQSLKPKLDILIHHMQLNNIDMCFVTETWTQYGHEPMYQYIRPTWTQLDTTYASKAEKTGKEKELQ